MRIYTNCSSVGDAEQAAELDMGQLSSPSKATIKTWRGPLALDNGAFSAWTRGFPFNETAFWKHLNWHYDNGFKLDFLVCPDLVAQGKRSLQFSCRWAEERLYGAPRLALAVQDGMTEDDLLDTCMLDRFSHLFVGGSLDWKWRTAEAWVKFAHSRGLKCHIGRCGTLDRLLYAHQIGADSVDSSSIARNGTWQIVREFRALVQDQTAGPRLHLVEQTA